MVWHDNVSLAVLEEFASAAAAESARKEGLFLHITNQQYETMRYQERMRYEEKSKNPLWRQKDRARRRSWYHAKSKDVAWKEKRKIQLAISTLRRQNSDGILGR